MNPYLAKLREQYNAMKSASEGIQTRAAEANASLTEVELATIKSQGEQMRALLAEIDVLAAEELRHAEYAKTVASLAPSAPAASSFAGVSLGAAEVKPRDPGHYRSIQDGGSHSFFQDMTRAAILQDSAAQGRLAEHNAFMRAETTSSIAGVVPPVWLANEFTTKAQEGRVLAGAVRNLPLADGRAFTLPGQTANTTVAAQSAENDALVDSDAYAATGISVTPVTVVGKETVSRQLLDSSTPGIDQLILADLVASYNADIEARLGVAIRAVGSATTVAIADFIDPTDAAWGPNTLADIIMAVRKVRYARPTHFACDYELFTELLKLKDTTGRPLIALMGDGMNSAGSASVNADGYIMGVPLLVSEGMNKPATTDLCGAAIVADDVCLFESAQMSFKYEEKSGPQSIELGLWRYAAVAVRQATRSAKNLIVDITP